VKKRNRQGRQGSGRAVKEGGGTGTPFFHKDSMGSVPNGAKVSSKGVPDGKKGLGILVRRGIGCCDGGWK